MTTFSHGDIVDHECVLPGLPIDFIWFKGKMEPIYKINNRYDEDKIYVIIGLVFSSFLYQ